MKKSLFFLLIIFFYQTTTYAQHKWKLVWADEFNYTGLPDHKKWDYEEGFVRNHEPQYYTAKRLENSRVENGMLIIEARKEKYPNSAYQQGSDKWNQKDQFSSYTSASLITKGKQSWRYGRMEIRAKVSAGQGSWPAFWMLGNNHNEVKWPLCGEIDIMEFLGRDSTRVHGTVHYADSAANYIHRSQGEGPVVGKPADGFHVYAIDWNENQITFYYDDLKYFVFDYKSTPYFPGSTFQKKFYLIINLALGHPSSWAGTLDDKILPNKYYVDYVRVYQ